MHVKETNFEELLLHRALLIQTTIWSDQGGLLSFVKDDFIRLGMMQVSDLYCQR